MIFNASINTSTDNLLLLILELYDSDTILYYLFIISYTILYYTTTSGLLNLAWASVLCRDSALEFQAIVDPAADVLISY